MPNAVVFQFPITNSWFLHVQTKQQTKCIYGESHVHLISSHLQTSNPTIFTLLSQFHCCWTEWVQLFTFIQISYVMIVQTSYPDYPKQLFQKKLVHLWKKHSVLNDNGIEDSRLCLRDDVKLKQTGVDRRNRWNADLLKVFTGQIADSTFQIL